MNLLKFLPTQKVSAFLLGGAITIVGFWFAVDVLEVLDEMPDALVLSSFVLIVGAIVAWIVPEGMWAKLQKHVGPVELPPSEHPDKSGH